MLAHESAKKSVRGDSPSNFGDQSHAKVSALCREVCKDVVLLPKTSLEAVFGDYSVLSLRRAASIFHI